MYNHTPHKQQNELYDLYIDLSKKQRYWEGYYRATGEERAFIAYRNYRQATEDVYQAWTAVLKIDRHWELVAETDQLATIN